MCESLQISPKTARSDSRIMHREEHDEGQRNRGVEVSCRRLTNGMTLSTFATRTKTATVATSGKYAIAESPAVSRRRSCIALIPHSTIACQREGSGRTRRPAAIATSARATSMHHVVTTVELTGIPRISKIVRCSNDTTHAPAGPLVSFLSSYCVLNRSKRFNHCDAKAGA